MSNIRKCSEAARKCCQYKELCGEDAVFTEGSKCAACGFEYYGTGISRFRYCPNCGLPMDGGTN